MCGNDSVLVFFVGGDKFVEEAEELVDLRFGKVGVVCSVFNFKCICVFTFACHDVRERVQAGVAVRDADSVVPVFLEQLD